jgi:hypothetical protein
MLLAMLYPEPAKGGRGKKSEAINSADSAGFSARRLQNAREIVPHPDLRDGVIAGCSTRGSRRWRSRSPTQTQPSYAAWVLLCLPDLGKTEQNGLSYARTVLRDRDERLRIPALFQLGVQVLSEVAQVLDQQFRNQVGRLKDRLPVLGGVSGLVATASLSFARMRHLTARQPL